jgi:glyoxylase-like metal-dependent hydrolase (beta-lactamase superfamily II)
MQSRAVRLQEPPPPVGIPLHEHEGAFRVVAPNPGPMTYHGTNTWFIETEEPGGPLALLDPGPDDDAHLAAILQAGAGRITHLLVSHAHGDHIALAPRLAQALDLPIHAHPAIARVGIDPGIPIGEGSTIGRLTALHTPGHALDHLCFAYGDSLFTADHVMGWSTSVVPPPPEGDAGDYLLSLRRLLERDDRRYLSGHGPVIENPRPMVTSLIAGRLRRGRQIAELVRSGVTDLETLTARLYPTLKQGLNTAARANLAGHIARLEHEGTIAPGLLAWRQTEPTPPAF